MNLAASVIISVYDNVLFLKYVLDSLKMQTVRNFEIIISEDAEHESMRSFVCTYPFENPYQHITQADNGWQKNRALNNAIRASRTGYLIFIDGDCVLHHRFVETHIRHSAPHRVLAGKRVKLDNETTLRLLSDYQKRLPSMQLLLWKKLLRGSFKSIRFLDEGFYIPRGILLHLVQKFKKANRLTGSNMSFHKTDILAINGFDESYTLPSVGEDTDLFWRFKRNNCNLKSIRNQAIQYHLYHPEIWNDRTENLAKMSSKIQRDEYICLNGIEKNKLMEP